MSKIKAKSALQPNFIRSDDAGAPAIKDKAAHAIGLENNPQGDEIAKAGLVRRLQRLRSAVKSYGLRESTHSA